MCSAARKGREITSGCAFLSAWHWPDLRPVHHSDAAEARPTIEPGKPSVVHGVLWVLAHALGVLPHPLRCAVHAPLRRGEAPKQRTQTTTANAPWVVCRHFSRAVIP